MRVVDPVLHPVRVFAGRVRSAEGDHDVIVFLVPRKTRAEAYAACVFDKAGLRLEPVAVRRQRERVELLQRKGPEPLGEVRMVAIGGRGMFAHGDEVPVQVGREVVGEGEYCRACPRNG